ncbi:Mak10-domain-containing protein [Fomitopsis serialis]|uniref:Mak10-domain-containing protein n=1 Tax=Fomitopsis serialis TaxID=139415 RepID=UPI00200743FF|nr:Mak10-domain-containing protein [Neoantrodia serialis]KAH9930842.1 Mak10-domain-containing protein [Neoantrodia serialis]
MDAMDVDLPGGNDYEDVTELFAEAANDMEPEVLVMTKTFSLLDAMSAFEIGEPRMDSGMITEPQRRPRFDPLAPMLPQEICWILDRAFACEMEWHAGTSLTQTVYTLLYVHHLDDLNPDFIGHQQYRYPRDPRRPQELLTVVMRASAMALLKSCDLAWRELSKGKVFDIEDWLGEKSEVSILEGISADFVLRKIDDACTWLQRSRLSTQDTQLLYDRLLLRKAVLQLLKLTPPLSIAELRRLTTNARTLLQKIRSQRIAAPAPNSSAAFVFDPHISRRLACFMPVRIIDLPPQEQAWDTLSRLLDGWEELSYLLDAPCISTWEIAGCLRIWSPRKNLHPAYLRSLTQSAVYDRGTVIGRLPPMWLVDHFFEESVGCSYDTVLLKICIRDDSSAMWVKREIENRICKYMADDLRANSHNPPRRRRYFMKAALQWHEVYDFFLQLIPYCEPSVGGRGQAFVDLMPNIAVMRRLAAAREIILSGLQQDLHAREEVPIAYWYLSRILEAHLECIDQVMSVTTQPHEEMNIQLGFLTALQAMSAAMCTITYKQCTLPYQRTALNFVRRYKWAFKPEYEDLAPAMPLPDLRLFTPGVEQMLLDTHYSPAQSFAFAGNVLDGLGNSIGFAGIWAEDRRVFFQDLARVCRQLEALPASSEQILSFDVGRLKWVDRTHPWFPDLLV